MQELLETRTSPSLLGVQQVHYEDGPSLSLDQQLFGDQELQVLHAVHVLHVLAERDQFFDLCECDHTSVLIRY